VTAAHAYDSPGRYRGKITASDGSTARFTITVS